MVTPKVSVVNVYLVDGSVLASVPVEPGTSPQPGKLIVNHIASAVPKSQRSSRFVAPVTLTRSRTNIESVLNGSLFIELRTICEYCAGELTKISFTAISCMRSSTLCTEPSRLRTWHIVAPPVSAQSERERTNVSSRARLTLQTDALTHDAVVQCLITPRDSVISLNDNGLIGHHCGDAFLRSICMFLD
jgi:hypothetical protein